MTIIHHQITRDNHQGCARHDDDRSKDYEMSSDSSPRRISSRRSSSSSTPASATVALLICFLASAIGVVTPFAGADVGSSIRHPHLSQQQLQRSNSLQRTAQFSAPTSSLTRSRGSTTSTTTVETSTISSLSSSSSSTTSLQLHPSHDGPSSSLSSMSSMSESSAAVAPSQSQRRRAAQRIRSFLSQLNPLPGRKDGRWKGGESKAKLASRLLFSYVGPLLDVTKNRTLTEDDAFEVAESRTMTHSSVDALTTTYENAKRAAAQQRNQPNYNEKQQHHHQVVSASATDGDNSSNNNKRKQQIGDPVKKSRTLVLTRALIRSQRSMLIFTAFMRLLNTAIQAFPAILVARLLRAVEAGPTQPLQDALKPALLLVGVLSIKMVVENAYFHNVVNMSTQVRGSIEGLIFDKSLRLPDGGSGVLAKKDTTKKGKEALGSGGVSP